MANEQVVTLLPRDFTASTNQQLPTLVKHSATTAQLFGLSLDKTGNSYQSLVRINAEHTMGTGLTLEFLVSDDGTLADDLGKVIRLGVTAKLIATGADTVNIASGAGTEQTVDVTLDATTGEVVIGSLAIANANLDSAAVGGTLLVSIRRVGTHANDTCKNRVLLYAVNIKNT